jgi:hypothetical protein
MNPFDYVNSINSNKKDIMVDDESEKGYVPFIINRQLSYFADTVFFANEMNRYHLIDNKLQFHFLLNITRKRKRFAKWSKPEEHIDLEAVKEYYGYSNEKARSSLTLLTPNQLTSIRNKVYKGGK